MHETRAGLPHLIVNHIRMRRRVEGIDGPQDVLGQIGQVDDGVGDHRLYVGCARHQERNGCRLTTWRHRRLSGVILLEEIKKNH